MNRKPTLKKRVVLNLSKYELKNLKGGKLSADENQVGAHTHAHDTHVNTCFTKNCCNQTGESDY